MARLRALSDRLKDRLIAARGSEDQKRDALARARYAGWQEASEYIAAEIRAAAPRPHRPGDDCPGLARCVTCSANRQAWRLAELAELTRAGR
jgi:hypothetical protein